MIYIYKNEINYFLMEPLIFLIPPAALVVLLPDVTLLFLGNSCLSMVSSAALLMFVALGSLSSIRDDEAEEISFFLRETLG